MKISPRYLIIALTIALLGCGAFNTRANTRAIDITSDTLDVLNYDINLDIVNMSYKTMAGYTDIQLTPLLNDVGILTFSLLGLTVDSIFVDGVTIPAWSYNDTTLRIPLSLPININDTVTVRVKYHGQPEVDPSWGGFYFTSDSSYAYNIGVAFTSSPHTFGRVWFPCVDEFVDRATFDCRIKVKNDKKVVCGGTLQSVTDHGNGTSTWYWRLADPIPTYLASIAIANFAIVNDTFNGIAGDIPIQLWVLAGDSVDALNSFVNLKNVLTVFEDRFGPYRFERVGYAGVPFTGGAMEHATNIAYPNVVINGTLAYEYLYAHELSHGWFGDLVTCRSALDMWINEGWATYAEAIYKEGLYGYKTYKDYNRTRHLKVVQGLHIEDGGYLAVYGIPHDLTYSSTVYEKGADVTQTLRGTLGDSLFFSTVKAWMNTFAFSPCSSTEMRDFFSTQTGMDMTDFWDAWVFAPGFPHFSVDSFLVSGSAPPYDVTVWVRQKLDNAPAFANSNVLEISFMNNNWQQFTDTIHFSGQFGSKTFRVPFAPDFVMMDKEEKIADATTDLYRTLKTTGLSNFLSTFLVLDVATVTDSAFIRVEHNWVAPDSLKIPNPDIKRLSNYRYWKVDGIFPAGFVTGGRFYYTRNAGSNASLDNGLLTTINSADSILLLYRRNTADDWRVIDFIRSGGSSTGNLITDTIWPGEYTLAVGTPYTGNVEPYENKDRGSLEVFPNPSNNGFTFSFDIQEDADIKIFDLAGKQIDNIPVRKSEKNAKWQPAKSVQGTYNAALVSEAGQLLSSKKILVLR